MNRFYAFVILSFLLAVLVFLGSFFYLDREKHDTFHYVVSLEGHDTATIKVDNFRTEDKLIYRSLSQSPFDPLFSSSKSRLTLDKEYNIESYSKDSYGRATAEEIYLENNNNSMSFVAVARSKFSYLENIPLKKKTFVFEEASPMTYLPIIENYDFKKGGPQVFSAVTHSSTYLPPMKRTITLTSIRDEYIRIGAKKVKTECLLLKIRNYPQGMLWVAKSDRSLVMLEIPMKFFRITRRPSLEQIAAKEDTLRNGEYTTNDVEFKSGERRLAGTLTTPKGPLRPPAILFVWGEMPQEREYMGLFTSISDGLSRQGVATFSFDGRQIPLGDKKTIAIKDSDIADDINSALDYLKRRGDIDPQKIFILTHCKGAFYAAKAASARNDIAGLIMMAPLPSLSLTDGVNFDNLKEAALKFKWNESYVKLVTMSYAETLDKINNNKRSWISIRRRRCFLDNMREGLNENPIETYKKLAMPVLILQGRKDEYIPVESAALIDNAIGEGGNRNHSVIYFSYLDHFFGNRINDGTHKIHYEADNSVLAAVSKWLGTVETSH